MTGETREGKYYRFESADPNVAGTFSAAGVDGDAEAVDFAGEHNARAYAEGWHRGTLQNSRLLYDPESADPVINFTAVWRAEELENQAYNARELNSNPGGAQWVDMVLEIARDMNTENLQLTRADMDQLTEDNYHTARRAAEVYGRLYSEGEAKFSAIFHNSQS